MKRHVSGILLASALVITVPVVAPGMAHAAAPVKQPAAKPAAKPAAPAPKAAVPAKPAAPVKPAAPAPKAPVAAPVKLLDGVNELPRWMDANTLIVTRVTDDKKADYKINVKTKAFAPVLSNDTDGAELVLAPDGKTAVFMNEANQLFTVDLATSAVKQVSEDKSMKSELQFSKDGQKLYFLQGDKTNVIASVSLADGTLTKLVDDKVEYKSSLKVSEDGTKFNYLVEKGGKLTADSPKEGDDKSVEDAKIELDLSGTEPQLYAFDTKAAEPKAVQITTAKDNKLFLDKLSDGRFVYVSVDTEKENAAPILKVVSADGKEVKNLVADVAVLQSVQVSGDRLLVLTEAGGKKSIYEVNATTGAKTKVADVNANTNQIYVSADGKQVALSIQTENGEKIAVLAGAASVDVTK